MICFTKTAYAVVLAMIAVAGVSAVANPEANPAAAAAANAAQKNNNNNVLKRAP
ncbi:hypothetical protein FB639_003034, partial [Coemansia asiatica]